MNRKNSGYGIIEYILGVGILVGILFAPVNNGKSVSKMLIDAVKKEHSAYVYAASMPHLPKKAKK